MSASASARPPHLRRRHEQPLLNLEAFEAEQLHYVTHQLNGTLMRIISELPAEHQLDLGDRTRLIEVESEGRRYVIAGGAWRQQRDREGKSG